MFCEMNALLSVPVWTLVKICCLSYAPKLYCYLIFFTNSCSFLSRCIFILFGDGILHVYPEINVLLVHWGGFAAQKPDGKVGDNVEDIVIGFEFQGLSDLGFRKSPFPCRMLEYESCSPDSCGVGRNAQSSSSTDEETRPTCPLG